MSKYETIEIKKELFYFSVIIKNTDKDLSEIIENYDNDLIFKMYIVGDIEDKKNILSQCVNLQELTLKYCNNIEDIPETLINLKKLNIMYCEHINNYTHNLGILLNKNIHLHFFITHRDIIKKHINEFFPLSRKGLIIYGPDFKKKYKFN